MIIYTLFKNTHTTILYIHLYRVRIVFSVVLRGESRGLLSDVPSPHPLEPEGILGKSKISMQIRCFEIVFFLWG